MRLLAVAGQPKISTVFSVPTPNMATEKQQEHEKTIAVVRGDYVQEFTITAVPATFPDVALTCSSESLVKMFDRYIQNEAQTQDKQSE